MRRLANGYTFFPMTTTLQAWGNSHGVRFPKALLTALGLETGAAVEVELTPKEVLDDVLAIIDASVF